MSGPLCTTSENLRGFRRFDWPLIQELLTQPSNLIRGWCVSRRIAAVLLIICFGVSWIGVLLEMNEYTGGTIKTSVRLTGKWSILEKTLSYE